MPIQSTINSEFACEQHTVLAKRLFDEHKYVTCTFKIGKPRTGLQNNSLHKYCDMLAKALNDAGHEMVITSTILKSEIHVPWSGESVKEHIWKPVQLVLTGHKSTTAPTTKEYMMIYETITRHLTSEFGILVEWPSKETQAA